MICWKCANNVFKSRSLGKIALTFAPLEKVSAQTNNETFAVSRSQNKRGPSFGIPQTFDSQHTEWSINSGFNFGSIPIHNDIQRKEDICSCGGGCPRCNIQAKLKISQAGDIYEQEADKVTDQVMRMSSEKVSRKCTSCEMKDDEEIKIHRKFSATNEFEVSDDVVNDINSIRGNGSPLDQSTRDMMESKFGYDFSKVRIHSDDRAAKTADAVNARAYTVGNDIVFGREGYSPHTTSGKHLLVHELAHVVQQNDVFRILQRYESGEHAKFGETQTELIKLAKTKSAKNAVTYKVKAGDTLEKIATQFKISVEELKESNKDKLKKWPASDGSGRKIEGFNANDEIVIPGSLTEFTKETMAMPEWSIKINGVELTYGTLIAMADLFGSPTDIENASKDELQKITDLIKKEKSGTAGKSVTTSDWESATGGRYLEMAKKNEEHFAPSDTKLVTSSGKSTANHKIEWEKWHRKALEKSQAGQKPDAMFYNAFGDHYLTDAFSAGHLINKRDVMELFKGQLPFKVEDSKKKFLDPKTAEPFFDEVAKKAFVGAVKTEFSNYETVELHYGFHPNINSESRFSTLLQGIYMEEPDLLANAVAKAIHDNLNSIPGGLPVVNNMGNKWNLSGDATLNTQTLEIGRMAVAQSQLNVLETYQSKESIDFSVLFKKVWDYTPQPDSVGISEITSRINSGTTTTSAVLISAVADLITNNYALIIAELVKRGILKRA